MKTAYPTGPLSMASISTLNSSFVRNGIASAFSCPCFPPCGGDPLSIRRTSPQNILGEQCSCVYRSKAAGGYGRNARRGVEGHVPDAHILVDDRGSRQKAHDLAGGFRNAIMHVATLGDCALDIGSKHTMMWPRRTETTIRHGRDPERRRGHRHVQ